MSNIIVQETDNDVIVIRDEVVITSVSNYGFYNVRSYGATGLNGQDPTLATSYIQDAIDAAIAAGGGAVYFPAGTYRINSALTINGTVRLQGASTGIPATPSVNIKQMTAGENAFTLTEGADYCLFEHLFIKYQGTGASTGVGVSVADIRDFTMQHCYVTLFDTNLYFQDAEQASLYNVCVQSPITYGINIVRTDSTDGGGINLTGCYFWSDDASTTAISATGGTGSLLLNGVEINSHDVGLSLVPGAGNSFTNLVITGCAIEDQNVVSISINGTDSTYTNDIVIGSNTFSGAPSSGFITITGTERVAVQGNNFSWSSAADSTGITAVTFVSSTICSVANNTIHEVMGGIQMSACSNFTCVGNAINGAASSTGLVGTGSAIKLGTGCSNGVISNNAITLAGYGIELVKGSSSINVSNSNTYTGCTYITKSANLDADNTLCIGLRHLVNAATITDSAASVLAINPPACTILQVKVLAYGLGDDSPVQSYAAAERLLGSGPTADAVNDITVGTDTAEGLTLSFDTATTAGTVYIQCASTTGGKTHTNVHFIIDVTGHPSEIWEP